MQFPAAIVLALALPWIRGAAAREATPPPEPPARPDRVALLTLSDPAYARIQIPENARVAPSAVERLLVYRKGVCIVDRGLRSIRQPAPSGGGEMGLAEIASVAPDAAGAAIVITRWEARVDANVVDSRIVWIDPLHPDGAWSVKLEPGRQVKEILALSASFGVAAATFTEGDPLVDLRMYGPDGRERSRSDARTGSVVDLAVSDDGGFLGADLALPPQEGGPDRGIVVSDLVRGTRWQFTWRYGSEDEPKSWYLATGGILELRTAGDLLRFDSVGTPIRGRRRGR